MSMAHPKFDARAAALAHLNTSAKISESAGSTPRMEPMPTRAAVTAAPESLPAVLALLDKALSLQAPLVDWHIARLRRKRADATPAEITKRLNAEFRAATISAGAAVGTAAAAPGVGTAAALALSGAEALGFLNATALYVLSRAEVHGVALHDIDRRRTLVMAVMLGEAGAMSVERVAERTGKHWAKQLVKNIPMEKVLAVNKVLGRHFVTKYGTKQGIVVLGRVLPFGIGAANGGTANAIFSQGIIKAADLAFGDMPESWEADDVGAASGHHR